MAHRQVPIAEQEWHLLSCRVEEGGTIYVNTVDTFGVASASYYWSRVASAIGRLTQYLAGARAETWLMLVTDDFHLETAGEAYRPAPMVFFVLCAVSGVPLSWGKTAGGDIVTWVGLELLHRSYQIGISARRAEWFTRWTRDVAASHYTHMRKFEEGLGRVMYVVSALEFERPFLGPLFKFMALHPRNSIRRVPSHVSFILSYLAAQIQESRLFSCATVLVPCEAAPRVDAPASLSRTRLEVGGRSLARMARADPARSRWFSHEVQQADWPWVFSKGGRPSLVISTLEALAVLMALKLFHRPPTGQQRTAIRVVPTWTDTRGNGAALNRLMTTRFPASAVIMEMATFMKKAALKAQVEWSFCSGNGEADALANGSLHGFDPTLRCEVVPGELEWEILPKALEQGAMLEHESRTAKERGRLPDRVGEAKEAQT